MSSTINTNVNSLNAQRNLGMSAGSLASSMQRLSSGLRVNSAKDDAAGLAIAERFLVQSKGLTVGSRNANDGISLAQTAEGALGKVGDMLQRMRELAVQSSNSTNSKSDRASLQAEVKQLTDEIDRVAKQTGFNNQKILDGSFGGAVFQVGANAGDNITIGGLTNSSAKGLGDIVFRYENAAAAVVASTITNLAAITNPALLQITSADGLTVDLGTIKAASSGEERLGQMVEAVNRKTAETGLILFMSRNDTGTYKLEYLASRLDSAGDALAVSVLGFTGAQTGLGSGAISQAVNSTNTTTDALGIDTLTIDTQRNAWVALKKIDSAINQVNAARAELGALQSRFESAVGNIEISVENISAARGRIVDADFAKETANLSRTQILQQAGTAMVAQANQLPQGVLALLR